MNDPHGLALNRRDLLKSIGTLSVAGSTASMFVPIAGAAEATREWTGYSICDDFLTRFTFAFIFLSASTRERDRID